MYTNVKHEVNKACIDRYVGSYWISVLWMEFAVTQLIFDFVDTMEMARCAIYRSYLKHLRRASASDRSRAPQKTESDSLLFI